MPPPLREAVKECEDGTIKGYPDLEIASIDKFMNDLKEAAETLLVSVGRVVDTLDRLAAVHDKEDANPEQ